MKKFITIVLTCILCSATAFADRNEDIIKRIVPKPRQTEQMKGSFKIKGAAFRCDPALDAASIDCLKRFSARVSLVSGKSCPFSSTGGLASTIADGSAKGIIFIKDGSMHDEEYRIEITPRYCVVRTSGFYGTRNAVATLMQMLPESVYSIGNGSKDKWTLPACIIADKPGRQERALLADCAGRFRSIEELKAIVDIAVKYKFSTVKLILSSDDRWRFKGETSSPFAQVSIYYDGGNEKGVYLPTEVSDLKKYADRNGISLVPELIIPSKILDYMELTGIPDNYLDEIGKTFGCLPVIVTSEEGKSDIENMNILELAEKVWK